MFPPSTETSTAPTTPPPESTAVPEMVTVEPGPAALPEAGEVIVDWGGVVSVEGVAGKRPLCNAAG